jgi:hypothetical protein
MSPFGQRGVGDFEIEGPSDVTATGDRDWRRAREAHAGRGRQCDLARAASAERFETPTFTLPVRPSTSGSRVGSDGITHSVRVSRAKSR